MSDETKAVVPVPAPGAVATRPAPGALAVPQGMEDLITFERPAGRDEGLLGTEGLTREDKLMPRISLAQKMSPEIDGTSPKHIKGLTFTDIFHTETRRNYGNGPLYFAILKREDPRFVEFKPLSEGGGIRNPNVSPNSPLTRFGPNGEKPVATMFRDYAVLMLNDFDPSDPLKNVVALSFKSTGLRAARNLNHLTSLRGKKLICKGVYAMTSGHETDKKTQGVYAVYKFTNAGWLPPGSFVEHVAVELFEGWKEIGIQVEREHADDGDPDTIDAERQPGDEPSFNPADYEDPNAPSM